MKGRNISKIIVIIFILFLVFSFIINAVTSDISFSENENRYLKEKPNFSFKNLFNGTYTKEYEEYVTDQFYLRDKWVSLKSISEKLLLKTENNGIYICEDGYLIKSYKEPDFDLMDKNIKSINVFSEKINIPVYIMTIPGSVKILEDKLPKYAPNYDQELILNYLKEHLDNNINIIDVYNELMKNNSKYIFYKTDHHWTTLGAYFGYKALMEYKKEDYVSLEEYEEIKLTDKFYGTSYSSSGVRFIAPDIIYKFYNKNQENVNISVYEDSEIKEGVLYDLNYLKVKDKYSVFLGGNHPLIKINTNKENGKNLLVFKDSYFNSLAPFLVGNYSNIHVVDLRYYKGNFTEYIKENKIDEVLFLYSIDNFTSDKNIIMLNMVN